MSDDLSVAPAPTETMTFRRALLATALAVGFASWIGWGDPPAVRLWLASVGPAAWFLGWDLGFIPPEVETLRRKYRYPGMKILQFAFSGGADNPYLPFRHDRDCVVYTGTHDNDTSLGWYQVLDPGDRALVDEFLGCPTEPMPWPLIRAALASRAYLAILPMQDLLALDGDHRMNVPGTAEGNWTWRFSWDLIPTDLSDRVRRMVGIYGR